MNILRTGTQIQTKVCFYLIVSVILWYPSLQVFAIQLTVFLGVHCKALHPLNIHSVSRHCNVSPGQVFSCIPSWLAGDYISTYS